jgi:GAF domain-containing protein
MSERPPRVEPDTRTSSVASGVERATEPIRIRREALAEALRACTSRECWSELVVSTALAWLEAERVVVSFDGRREPAGPEPLRSVRAELSLRTLSAPLRAGGRLIGVLEVHEPRRAGGFSIDDADCLLALAELAGSSWPPVGIDPA